MTYEINLRDDAKDSGFLVVVDGTYVVSPELIRNPGTENSFIDLPFGEPVGLSVTGNNQSFLTKERIYKDSIVANGNPIEDTGAVLSGYNRLEKRYYLGNNQNNRFSLRLRFYFSSFPNFFFKDPTLNSGDMVVWEPLVISTPTISRDISKGFYGVISTIVSSFDVSLADTNFDKVFYRTRFNKHPIKIFHLVGQKDETSDYIKLFEGEIENANAQEKICTFGVSDGSSFLNNELAYQNDPLDFSELGSSYNVSEKDVNKAQRRIYGRVSGIRAVNVDQSIDKDNPQNDENRIWVFASYNGDDTKIKDVNITESSTLGYYVEDNPSFEDRLVICKIFDFSDSNSSIISLLNNYGLARGDRIKLDCDTFSSSAYLNPQLVKYGYSRFDDFLNGNGIAELKGFNEITGANKGIFYCVIQQVDLFEEIGSQVGLTANQVRIDIRSDNNTSLYRPVVSRLFIRNQDNDNIIANYGEDYTTFLDSTKKIYGIRFNDDFETSKGITRIQPDDLVFGTAYGSKVTKSKGVDGFPGLIKTDNYNQSSVDVYASSSNNNNTMTGIIFEYFKEFMGLEDERIDLNTFDLYDEYYSPDIFTNNGNKNLRMLRDRVFSNFSCNFIEPQKLEDNFPTIKKALTDIGFFFNTVFFINNEGKWTFRQIIGQTDQDPTKILEDHDFEILSPERFTNIDCFGILELIYNNINFASDPDFDNTSIPTYFTSPSGFRDNNDSRLKTFNTSFQDTLINEDTISSYITNPNNQIGVNTGIWFLENQNIFNDRLCELSVTVDRRFFNIDIGDVIQINSRYLTGSGGDLISRKYIVVGIQQNVNNRILKLNDIIQSLEDRGLTRSSVPVDNLGGAVEIDLES